MSYKKTKYKLNVQLPPEVQNILKDLGQDKSATVDITEFIKKKLVYNRHKEIDTELKSYFRLKGINLAVRKKEKIVRKKRSPLSIKERRELGCSKLPKKGLNYATYEHMYNLWCQYMADYLDTTTLKKHRFTGDPTNKHFNTVSTKLMKADLHGAYLTVVKSKSPDLVGKEGIVLIEKKNFFQIIGKDNTVRMIPKKICEFAATFNGYRFQFHGKHICIRSSERSVKKNKNQLINDL